MKADRLRPPSFARFRRRQLHTAPGERFVQQQLHLACALTAIFEGRVLDRPETFCEMLWQDSVAAAGMTTNQDNYRRLFDLVERTAAEAP